jgi:hypothetical protein
MAFQDGGQHPKPILVHPPTGSGCTVLRLG